MDIFTLDKKLASGELFLCTYMAIDAKHPLSYLLDGEEERMIEVDDWESVQEEVSADEKVRINGLIEIGLSNIVIAKAD